MNRIRNNFHCITVPILFLLQTKAVGNRILWMFILLIRVEFRKLITASTGRYLYLLLFRYAQLNWFYMYMYYIAFLQFYRDRIVPPCRSALISCTRREKCGMSLHGRMNKGVQYSRRVVSKKIGSKGWQSRMLLFGLWPLMSDRTRCRLTGHRVPDLECYSYDFESNLDITIQEKYWAKYPYFRVYFISVGWDAVLIEVPPFREWKSEPNLHFSPWLSCSP